MIFRKFIYSSNIYIATNLGELVSYLSWKDVIQKESHEAV